MTDMKQLSKLLSSLAICCISCARGPLPAISGSKGDGQANTAITANVQQEPAARARSIKFRFLSNKARAKVAAGDDQAAEALFKEIIEMDPEIKGERAELADIYARQGRNKEAIELFRKVFEHSKTRWSTVETDSLVLLLYGELCLKEGLTDEARQAFERAIGKRKYLTMGPVHPRVTLLTGSLTNIRASATLVAAFRAIYPRRQVLARKAVELAPKWEGARFYLADFISRDSSTYLEAIEIFHSLRNNADPLIRSISKEREAALLLWKRQSRERALRSGSSAQTETK